MVEDLDSNSIATRTVPDKSATIIFQKMLSLTGTEGGENTGKGVLEKVDQSKLSSMERDELEMYYWTTDIEIDELPIRIHSK